MALPFQLRPRYRPITARADWVSGWLAIVLGFSIPISTAFDNLLLGLILLLWIVGGNYREKFFAVRDNPIALLALALFGVLLLGAMHGVAPPAERFRFLGKYKDLIFIGLLVYTFRDPAIRQRALIGFAAAMLLTLVLSTAISLGILPQTYFAQTGLNHNPTVFKLHITQNLLMAYAVFLFASAARYSTSGRRIWLILLSALAIYNVLFMVQGRTGHIVLGALMIFFFANWLRWKGLAIGVLAIALLSIAAFHESPGFHDRVLKVDGEYQIWRADKAIAKDNSIGLRMQWYRACAAIIGEHPLIGVGTGGFARAYAAEAGEDTLVARNPHSEYLLLAVQLGPFGVLFLLTLFYRQWRLAYRLPDRLERDLAHGLVLTMAVGCLFNSFLIDHTEGLFFAWLSALLFAGSGRRKAQAAP